MSDDHLQRTIDTAFEARATIGTDTGGEVRDAVDTALRLLDEGRLRVSERTPDGTGKDAWRVNQWLKKAVLLSFRLNGMALVSGGPGGSSWYDKVPSKFEGWSAEAFAAAGFRAVPNCVVRRSAYIAPNVILMPSFVNLGAYVDSGTMVDTWVTVGSCAQIGRNVHLSGGVGIGGVLEPLQANPTIIEDDCFVGARSEVVEGVVVGQGLGAGHGGLHLRLDQDHRPRRPVQIHVGFVPPYSVVVPGNLPGQAAARRHPRALALLRRDRQDRRRADPLEDRHQRPPEGLMGARARRPTSGRRSRSCSATTRAASTAATWWRGIGSADRGRWRFSAPIGWVLLRPVRASRPRRAGVHRAADDRGLRVSPGLRLRADPRSRSASTTSAPNGSAIAGYRAPARGGVLPLSLLFGSVAHLVHPAILRHGAGLGRAGDAWSLHRPSSRAGTWSNSACARDVGSADDACRPRWRLARGVDPLPLGDAGRWWCSAGFSPSGLRAAGFVADLVTFSRGRNAGRPQSLRPVRDRGAPCLMFAGHTDVVPPGEVAARGGSIPFAGVDRRWGCCTGAGHCRHEKRRSRPSSAAAMAHVERHGPPAKGSIALLITGRRGRAGRQRDRQAARLGPKAGRTVRRLYRRRADQSGSGSAT